MMEKWKMEKVLSRSESESGNDTGTHYFTQIIMIMHILSIISCSETLKETNVKENLLIGKPGLSFGRT